MKCDIILAGVGGQGVLSLAAIIAAGAMKEKLQVKQSEVHGMSQRGGAVSANVRIADQPIASVIIPRGRARLILSLEPMESLRYLDYLAADGVLITADQPVLNIPAYSPMADIFAAIKKLPHSHILPAEDMAREAGAARAVNMVLAGAASCFLPLKTETMETVIAELFASKGEKVVAINLRAFRMGHEAGWV